MTATSSRQHAGTRSRQPRYTTIRDVTGKPLQGIGGRHDDNWWVKGLIEREQIKPPLPTSLMLRKEREDIHDTVADRRTEAGVRELVTDLNDRIVDSRRRRVDGPLLFIHTLDVQAVVDEWHRRRQSRAG